MKIDLAKEWLEIEDAKIFYNLALTVFSKINDAIK